MNKVEGASPPPMKKGLVEKALVELSERNKRSTTFQCLSWSAKLPPQRTKLQREIRPDVGLRSP